MLIFAPGVGIKCNTRKGGFNDLYSKSMPMDTFPNDDDGDALKRMAEHGMDLRKELNLEFYVQVPNESAAKNIVSALRAAAYDRIEIHFDEGELEEGEEMSDANQEFLPTWTVCIYNRMVPEYDKIVRIQMDLDFVSRPLGGQLDGWGVLEDERTSQP